MATGDPVIVEVGSVGGGSNVTVSVPSGEVWAISGYGYEFDCRLAADDGTRTVFVKQEGKAGTGISHNSSKAIYDENVQPNIDNPQCNSKPAFISGREL